MSRRSNEFLLLLTSADVSRGSNEMTPGRIFEDATLEDCHGTKCLVFHDSSNRRWAISPTPAPGTEEGTPSFRLSLLEQLKELFEHALDRPSLVEFEGLTTSQSSFPEFNDRRVPYFQVDARQFYYEGLDTRLTRLHIACDEITPSFLVALLRIEQHLAQPAQPLSPDTSRTAPPSV